MQDREPDEFRQSAALIGLWHTFRRNRIALFSFYAFILFILTALFGAFVAPYSADMQFVGRELTPPSWFSNGQVAFFFGTDDIGRDVFSRLINGFRYTFGGALIVVFFTAVIGGILGIATGMGRGAKSQILGHFLDAFLSTPILLIAIIIATLMQPSLLNAMLAIFLALLPHFVHEIYQAIQKELNKEYVMMLRLDGATNKSLLKEAVLPNIAVPYIKEVSRAFTIALLDISALSFIALGAQSPLPEWGTMLRDAIPLIYLAPWTVFLPGIILITTILVVIILGNGLCKAINQYYE
ncbi:cationic peptide transport system permease protein [Cricetibacter osteomyelitidis]|uniref:Cationic peptide transport system permease protein n=1 Tax=Cricetibacter osteomyelitidis TaxID=1521931 RepID=A0A4R2SPT0_9PAST|nr:ABC transporter permease subunit [Cricetibacter osteomyelitidis]TCP92169.1 cationic peptide transport system permease protein [Cricetibacter osteomyelitidis]